MGSKASTKSSCVDKDETKGDVKMRGGPETTDIGQEVVSTADRKLLEKLLLPNISRPLRSRFLSLSKSRDRGWRPNRGNKMVPGRLLVEDFYRSSSETLMGRLGQWDVDIFMLHKLTGGRSVPHVSMHIFQSYGFLKTFKLDPVRLVQFVYLVEENYHASNPYHNSIHAADVTQAMHCFIQEREMFESTTELEKFAALLAALCHDIDHPGVNNTFLIATENHLASLYEDLSVLENHHWRSAVSLLHETGLIAHFSIADREKFIAMIKSIVLATDITRHQDYILKFRKYIEAGGFSCQRSEEHRHFMLQIAIKCADISNPCRPWPISQRWSRRVCREFFLQGDTERSMSVPVTAICDRYANTVSNIQIGFFKFVVDPLFQLWNQHLATRLSKCMCNHLSHNTVRWKRFSDAGHLVSEVTSDEDEEVERDEERVSCEAEKLFVPATTAMEATNDNGVDNNANNTNSVDALLSSSAHSPTASLIQSSETTVSCEDVYDGDNEEDDTVGDNVNLAYHYTTDVDQTDATGRCLSPVHEDMEHAHYAHPHASSLRRFSVPYVRNELSYYLGVCSDYGAEPQEGAGHQLRRQSLPVSAMYFHGASTQVQHKDKPDLRRTSMDALLSRPKISNLSSNLEASFAGGGFDPGAFTPLQNQTLMLQGNSLTRFTYHQTPRRASADQASDLAVIHDPSEDSNLSNDLSIPSFPSSTHPTTQRRGSTHGLASSWPNMATRNTTNGSVYKDNVIRNHFVKKQINNHDHVLKPSNKNIQLPHISNQPNITVISSTQEYKDLNGHTQDISDQDIMCDDHDDCNPPFLSNGPSEIPQYITSRPQ